MKDKSNTQQCSYCQQAISLTKRYPHRICDNCQQLLTDNTGGSVAYANNDFAGGILGFYTDTNPPEPYNSLTCYIGNVAFRAQEGRFGGIIVQKLQSN